MDRAGLRETNETGTLPGGGSRHCPREEGLRRGPQCRVKGVLRVDLEGRRACPPLAE